MEEYKENLAMEYRELIQRIKRLKEFILLHKEDWKEGKNAVRIYLMKQQEMAMEHYLYFLQQRMVYENIPLGEDWI